MGLGRGLRWNFTFFLLLLIEKNFATKTYLRDNQELNLWNKNILFLTKVIAFMNLDNTYNYMASPNQKSKTRYSHYWGLDQKWAHFDKKDQVLVNFIFITNFKQSHISMHIPTSCIIHLSSIVHLADKIAFVSNR